MKSAILIHGWNTKDEFFDESKPTASNDHWFPWLSKQLSLKGLKVDAPEMPQYDLTTYESWKKEVERFDITAETTLVGHSCGGGFIVRYLSENDIRVDRVVLVAPWLGLDFGYKFDENFFKFSIDADLAQKTNGVTVIYSDDDFDAIKKSVNTLESSLHGVRYIEMHGKGHFTRSSLGREACPEVLKEVLDETN